MIDLINEIAQTIRNNKLRTCLTGIAVAWGVFMLIVLLGAVRGTTNAFEANSALTGTNTISVYSGRTSKGYKGYQSGRFIALKEKDQDAIQNSNLKVAETGVKVYGSQTNVEGDKDYVSVSLAGVYPQMKINEGISSIDGRFINQSDIDERRKVIVLPKQYAEQMFGSADKAIGKYVRAMKLGWQVVGVYDHRWRNTVYVPYTTYDGLTGFKGTAGEMLVTVDGLKTEQDGVQAETEIREALGRAHDFDPEDTNAVWIYNKFKQYVSGQQASGYLNLAGWVIGVLTLLTGIIGVSNIMFVSVRERTHEIGIRRAIGAKPRSVIIQVLSESVAITALFGYIGIVFGMIVLEILNALFGNSREFKNPTLDLSIAVEVTVALVIAGALAGLFPAIKATKVKPVEALRDE